MLISKESVPMLIEYILAVETGDERAMHKAANELDELLWPGYGRLLNEDEMISAPQGYIDMVDFIFEIQEYYGPRSPTYISPEEIEKSRKSMRVQLQAIIHLMQTKWRNE